MRSDDRSLTIGAFAGAAGVGVESAVYVYVEDADTLYAEWRASGATGRFFEPGDTDYGLREGAHIDLDGNLLRFGSAFRGR